jgi:hypothetical protein
MLTFSMTVFDCMGVVFLILSLGLHNKDILPYCGYLESSSYITRRGLEGS